MVLFCRLNELVCIKHLVPGIHSTCITQPVLVVIIIIVITGTTLSKRRRKKAQGKWAPFWSGLFYLRDRDDNWLPLERSSIRGQFQVFQEQLVAGDHMIPKHLGHEALFVPVFNL